MVCWPQCELKYQLPCPAVFVNCLLTPCLLLYAVCSVLTRYKFLRSKDLLTHVSGEAPGAPRGPDAAPAMYLYGGDNFAQKIGNIKSKLTVRPVSTRVFSNTDC